MHGSSPPGPLVYVYAAGIATRPLPPVDRTRLGRPWAFSIDPDAATNPTLIVEVLSDSTEAYDRGEKFAHHRRLPSLREYLLVSQREPRLEAYARNADGAWVLAELRSLEGVRLAVDVLYREPLPGG